MPADAQHKENYEGDKLGFRWSQGKGLDNVVPGKDFPAVILYRQETPCFPQEAIWEAEKPILLQFPFLAIYGDMEVMFKWPWVKLSSGEWH